MVVMTSVRGLNLSLAFTQNLRPGLLSVALPGLVCGGNEFSPLEEQTRWPVGATEVVPWYESSGCESSRALPGRPVLRVLGL